MFESNVFCAIKLYYVIGRARGIKLNSHQGTILVFRTEGDGIEGRSTWNRINRKLFSVGTISK